VKNLVEHAAYKSDKEVPKPYEMISYHPHKTTTTSTAAAAASAACAAAKAQGRNTVVKYTKMILSLRELFHYSKASAHARRTNCSSSCAG
jgi:hypothetical protein